MTLPIVHHADYDAKTVADDHRFPMRKYALVAELLREAGHSFMEPDAAPEDWLHLAHDEAYVTAILTQTLDAKAARKVGFEITPASARGAQISRSCSGSGLARTHTT